MPTSKEAIERPSSPEATSEEEKTTVSTLSSIFNELERTDIQPSYERLKHLITQVIEYIGKVPQKYARKALLWAIGDGDADFVEFLLDHGTLEQLRIHDISDVVKFLENLKDAPWQLNSPDSDIVKEQKINYISQMIYTHQSE